jgi:periplasmic protein TonB
MTKAERQYHRKRFALAAALALVFHAAVFLAFQYLLPLRVETLPEYGGPITVTIGENEAAAAAPAEVDAGVPNPPARSETRPPEAPRAEAGSPSVTAAAAKPPRPVVESREVPKTFEPAPPERLPEIKPLPVQPPSVKIPEMGERADKSLPFKPETKVEEPQSSVDLSKYDEASLKTKPVAPAVSSPSAEVKGSSKGSSQSGREGGEPATGQTSRGQGAAPGTGGAGASSAGSPLITWANAGQQRKLLSPAPPPDIPQWVKKEGIDLKVIVTFDVTPEGQTTGVFTAQSSGYPDVDAAVLDSVRKMKFNPAQGAGISRGTVNYIIRTR